MSRKAQLSLFTERYCKKNPGSTLETSLPFTMVVDTWAAYDDDKVVTMGDGVKVETGSLYLSEEERLKECCAGVFQVMDRYGAGEDTETTYILKPSATNQGAGITLIYCFEQLIDVLGSNSSIREWVLQTYVDRPLLLKGKKFHIRAYVLAVNAIQVFFYDEVLCLCSGTKYNKNATSLFGHITNTAYQAIDPGFKEEECVLVLEDVEGLLVKQGRSGADAKMVVQKILKDMQVVTGELFDAFKGEQSVYSPLPGCFEHSGLDFLVDEDFHVSLLEVNPGPDFKQTGERLQGVVREMMEETVDICLGGVEFDKERNGNKFTKVFDHKVRGGGGSGEVRMKLLG